MNTRKKMEMRRFGRMLGLLCLCRHPAACRSGNRTAGSDRTAGCIQWHPGLLHDRQLGQQPAAGQVRRHAPASRGAKQSGTILSGGRNRIRSRTRVRTITTSSCGEYSEQMHSDLPTAGTMLRGYVQVNNGTDTASCGGTLQPVCDATFNTLVPDPIHYLGPIIVAQRDRPVRIKFTNLLPMAPAGDLFIPVNESVMGAGTGPATRGGTRGGGAPCDNTVEGNTCAKLHPEPRCHPPAWRPHPLDQRRYSPPVDHAV